MLQEQSAALDLRAPIMPVTPVKQTQVIDLKKIKSRSPSVKAALRAFLGGEKQTSKSNPYKIKGDQLWYCRKRYINGKTKMRNSLIAFKLNGVFFGNSSEVWGRKAGSRRRDRRTAKQLEIQSACETVIPMLPLVLFRESKLDVTKAIVHEFGKPETLWFGRKDKHGNKIMQHFAGGLVFEIENNFFLFDLDRAEVAKNQFNAFMSKLPKPCSSFDEAYASLKPKEVSDAERFLQEPVARQGEWFFIPVQGEFTPDEKRMTAYTGWGADRQKAAKLQAKGNRAHLVSFMSTEGYVKGWVTHEGYEHKPIELKTWCKPVPNTAVESFKISGQID